jgi:hypothetical protein
VQNILIRQSGERDIPESKSSSKSTDPIIDLVKYKPLLDDAITDYIFRQKNELLEPMSSIQIAKS